MREFYGRTRELAVLRELLDKRTASLVVITGRRRIGKTRLIEEFGKAIKTYLFTGLPPEERVTGQVDRDHFSRQLEQQTGLKGIKGEDWDDLFLNLAQFVTKGQILVVFDEINWMGKKDPSFLGKLKTAWDTYFSKNPKLIMILSGSMSGWIEKHILKSTGFFGRITMEMKLDELPLPVCNQFWGSRKNTIAAYEKFKVLSVIGGIPRYLEEINPALSAEENIRRLCFRKEGLLFREYDRICTELFARRGDSYEKILKRLAQGAATLEDIYETLEIDKSGTISQYLEDLEAVGYISRDHTWNLKSKKVSPISHYRLCDNYLRFYLRYISGQKAAIERGAELIPPNWFSIMGLQFENLVLNNRRSLFRLLDIAIEDVVIDNPYFQTRTKSREGSQIDYLIQTRHQNLYICEIKFQKDPIQKSIVDEVQEKVNRMKIPTGFSHRTVLIHVNGVTDSIVDCGYFAKIIDFGQLLEEQTP